MKLFGVLTASDDRAESVEFCTTEGVAAILEMP
jgi:hypothetical protein